MFFLLQTINHEIADVEVFNLKTLLDAKKIRQHDYRLLELEQFTPNFVLPFPYTVKEAVPVGTLEFVGKYLQMYHHIETMNPIEVPDCLRKEKYLKRKYIIMEKAALPSEGHYFVKYVSKLKQFSYLGDIQQMRIYAEETDIPEGLYQLSEIVDIVSEYRAFILDDTLQSINYYNGDCTIFPDANLLKEMVMLYTLDKNRPKAYTLDIAIIKDRGTCILEIHPMTSCGTYQFYSGSLPWMYRYGLDYYLKHNQPLRPFTS